MSRNKKGGDIILYPHQKEVLQQTQNHNKVAYYLDMG